MGKNSYSGDLKVIRKLVYTSWLPVVDMFTSGEIEFDHSAK